MALENYSGPIDRAIRKDQTKTSPEPKKEKSIPSEPNTKKNTTQS